MSDTTTTTPQTTGVAPDETNPRYKLGTLEDRLTDWLQTQPDVSDLRNAGDGIYGLELAGVPGGVSLTLNITNP